MKTLKSDIFYAMNEINDKYILEAAQCLEQKKENDISLQKNSKLFHESNAHSRKWLARVATAMAVSIILFTTGGIANAATGEKLVQWINGLFGAELVTDENEGLIGKEVIDNSKSEITHGEESNTENNAGNVITESHIIKSVADDNIVLPLSVSEFKVENDTTPEIIMTNGSMAVFYLEDYAGWNCKAGDILIRIVRFPFDNQSGLRQLNKGGTAIIRPLQGISPAKGFLCICRNNMFMRTMRKRRIL